MESFAALLCLQARYIMISFARENAGRKLRMKIIENVHLLNISNDF